MKKIVLKIDGMTCASCSGSLEKFLNKSKGINSASVNLITATAVITYSDIEVSEIEAYIKEAGFKSLGEDLLIDEGKKLRSKRNNLIVLGIISVIVFYVSMAGMFGWPIVSYLNIKTSPKEYSVFLSVMTMASFYFGRDMLFSGFRRLIKFNPNMDSLVLISVVSSFVYSFFNTMFIINGNFSLAHDLYYEAATMVLFFIALGKYIEAVSFNKTSKSLEGLVSLTPSTAIVIRNEEEIVLPIDSILIGDVIKCLPGEKIAVDGNVIRGSSNVDEALITGESTPLKKNVGDSVIAGSINFDSVLIYEAVSIGRDTVISNIIALVNESINTKAPIADIADRVSGYFVPVIFLLSICGFILWMMLGYSFSFSINVFVTLLVIACPCALGLATPLSMVISTGKAAKAGILVKSSEATEIGSKVDTVVFDKTGTLTYGTLSVSSIITYDVLEEELLSIAASMEGLSEHPIAKAVVNSALDNDIKLLSVDEFKVIPGMGINGIIDKSKILIGNEKLMRENNVVINREDMNKLASHGSIMFVSRDSKLIGLISVRDVIRSDSKKLISDLSKRGLDVIMLTGDNLVTAGVIASELGIKEVIADVMPEGKMDVIEDLQSLGKVVMMVGDGINDAPSLVKSDVGVSVSSGTDIATSNASVVLINNKISSIVEFLDISKRTIRNVKQNLFWAFIYNIIMIPIAFGVLKLFGIDIMLSPMIASFMMMTSSVSVVLNALRLRNK